MKRLAGHPGTYLLEEAVLHLDMLRRIVSTCIHPLAAIEENEMDSIFLVSPVGV